MDLKQITLWALAMAGAVTAIILFQHAFHTSSILGAIGIGAGSRDQSGAVPTVGSVAALYPQLSAARNNPPYQQRRMGLASESPALGANVVSMQAGAPSCPCAAR